MLPAQNGPGSSSGTCGANGTQFCPQAWIEGLLGPILGAPPNVTDIVNSTASTNLTMCDDKCSGPQDCRPSDSDHDCSCAYPSPEDAIKLGFDLLFPTALCWPPALCLAEIFQHLLIVEGCPTSADAIKPSRLMSAVDRRME